MRCSEMLINIRCKHQLLCLDRSGSQVRFFVSHFSTGPPRDSHSAKLPWYAWKLTRMVMNFNDLNDTQTMTEMQHRYFGRPGPQCNPSEPICPSFQQPCPQPGRKGCTRECFDHNVTLQEVIIRSAMPGLLIPNVSMNFFSGREKANSTLDAGERMMVSCI